MELKESEKRFLAEKIKQLREERNLSQNQLAKRIGLRSQNIGKYEKAESVPSALVLKRMADILGVTADSLLSQNGDEQRIVKVKDKDLLEKIEIIDQMEEEDKQTLKNIIELLLLKHSVKKLQTA